MRKITACLYDGERIQQKGKMLQERGESTVFERMSYGAPVEGWPYMYVQIVYSSASQTSHVGVLLKYRLLSLTTRFLIQSFSSGIQEFLFLASSHQLLLIWGPQHKNDCSPVTGGKVEYLSICASQYWVFSRKIEPWSTLESEDEGTWQQCDMRKTIK